MTTTNTEIEPNLPCTSPITSISLQHALPLLYRSSALLIHCSSALLLQWSSDPLVLCYIAPMHFYSAFLSYCPFAVLRDLFKPCMADNAAQSMNNHPPTFNHLGSGHGEDNSLRKINTAGRRAVENMLLKTKPQDSQESKKGTKYHKRP